MLLCGLINDQKIPPPFAITLGFGGKRGDLGKRWHGKRDFGLPGVNQVEADLNVFS